MAATRKGRRKKGEPPAYLEHKATGRAYATVGGDSKYFGEYGTPESRRRYRAFIRDWERTHGTILRAKATDPIAPQVDEYLSLLRPKISPTEYKDIKRNLGTLKGRFGQWQPDEFRGAELKDLRVEWIDAGHFRPTVNKAVGRVRRFFKWLVGEDRCDPETLAVLRAVPDLERGGPAPEGEDVGPVPEGDFWKTVEQLQEPAKTIAMIQWHGGLRPDAAVTIQGEEIHRAGTAAIARRTLTVPEGVWLFYRAPSGRRQKAAYNLFGPQLQAILTPWLKAGRLFDFSYQGYYKAIRRAAKAAKVPHWAPHQIRHSFVSRMDAAAGLVIASEATGHASIASSLVYLQRRIGAVADVVRRLG